MPETHYRVEGILPLRGEVTVSGSKNAALPAMCAALLTEEEVTLRNVPDIADVHSLLQIFTFLNVDHSFEPGKGGSPGVLRLCARNLTNKPIPHEFVCKFRAAILLLGPLLARFGEAKMAYPGGCVIGKRSIDAHLDAFTQLGFENLSAEETVHLRGRVRSRDIVLPEFSVTATENLLLAVLGSPSAEVTVHLAAAEPHVQDLCRFLLAMGATMEGVGTHDLRLSGARLHGTVHTVTTDYLEAGFFALAGVLTGGDVRIRGAEASHLHAFLNALVRLGVDWEWESANLLHVRSGIPLKACTIRTNIFPGFPTDLQAAMGVAMTQAHGVSRLFERLFEGRFGYLFELEKMGAHVEILNSHEALIIGPTRLRGRTVTSNDIRAGAGMVLAALCARGETLITDVQYIERGYERLPEKLRMLGASLERLGPPAVESPRTPDAHDQTPTRRLRSRYELARVSHDLPQRSTEEKVR
jgi:UDP-N-acetylglucosamine 1-carboxyvinyltransferase